MVTVDVGCASVVVVMLVVGVTSRHEQIDETSTEEALQAAQVDVVVNLTHRGGAVLDLRGNMALLLGGL